MLEYKDVLYMFTNIFFILNLQMSMKTIWVDGAQKLSITFSKLEQGGFRIFLNISETYLL